MTTGFSETRTLSQIHARKMMNLENMVAIVAGGTGGIGSAVAQLLAEHNASVVVASRNANRRLNQMNRLTIHKAVTFIEADLRTWDGWQTVTDEVYNRFQRIDVLVNCVGTLKPGRFDTLSHEDLENIVATNFGSLLYGLRTVIPIMKKQRRGHIITIGSLGGVLPVPHETAYSATKFGVRGLSLALSKELQGSGVHVSLISPSSVKTSMLATEARDDNSDLAFYNKALKPGDIANAVLDVIDNPKDEIMLPRWTTKIGLFLNLHAGAFSLFYPLFCFIGRIRRKRFLKQLAISRFICFEEF